MLKLKSSKWLLLALCISGIFSLGFTGKSDTNKIHWMSFDEAVKLNEQHPKKIFIDIYTDWCGWCKRMDATTYTDPKIINLINTYYYAVRLNAETADTFHFKGHAFYNQKPHTKGYANELATSLMDDKMEYPTTVYMDETFSRLTYVQSYLTVADLKPILKFFAEDKYKTMNFDDFKKSETSQGGN